MRTSSGHISTRLTDSAQQRLWPDWRHHAFNANTEHDTAAADEFHRAHAVVELAIREGQLSGLCPDPP